MDINKRAWDMYRQIRMHCNLTRAAVVDFGCGYGDMLSFVLADGARSVLGIDKDQKVLNTAFSKCKRYGGTVRVMRADVEKDLGSIIELIGSGDAGTIDYAFCFSVLPYLKEPEIFLQSVQNYFDWFLIEMQYEGDGPGYIKNDTEMYRWLMGECGFAFADIIGRTEVLGRDKFRTIWKCSMGDEDG